MSVNTPVAPLSGVREITVGGEPGPVVKLHVRADSGAAPFQPFTPVPAVAV